MLFYLNALLSLLIVVPALITAKRYHQLAAAYRPLAWLLWAGAANEQFSIAVILSGYSNAPLYNLYGLAEALLLVYQLRKWGVPHNSKLRLYPLLQRLLAAAWAVEYLHSGMEGYLNAFLILRSGILTVLCCRCIAEQLKACSIPVLQNPILAVCAAMLPYYLYALLVELVLLAEPFPEGSFQPALVLMISAVNLYTNVLLIYAVLWIPQHLRYSLRSQPLG